MLDDAVIQSARALAESAGTDYQTMINNLLRSALLPRALIITCKSLKTVPKRL